MNIIFNFEKKSLKFIFRLVDFILSLVAMWNALAWFTWKLSRSFQFKSMQLTTIWSKSFYMKYDLVPWYLDTVTFNRSGCVKCLCRSITLHVKSSEHVHEFCFQKAKLDKYIQGFLIWSLKDYITPFNPMVIPMGWGRLIPIKVSIQIIFSSNWAINQMTFRFFLST